MCSGSESTARLFTSQPGRRLGPKGPTKDLIDAVVAMKHRNPRWGCPRIAQQIALAFGVEIDKDVVRRILAAHYRPESDSAGPSWLTFIGHTKDSLWSCDLFRCESAALRTHWVLIVMDQFTRRVIGFGVHSGIVDGVALCQMFGRAIRWHSLPKYLSSDHDPLYQFHQWQANLRVLEVTEIKTVPYAPLSHPFAERLIGTIRREYLDRMLFWTTADLETKLLDFQNYLNGYRTHAGLEGHTRTISGCGRNCGTNRSRFVPMAGALSRVVPNSNGRVIYEFATNKRGSRRFNCYSGCYSSTRVMTTFHGACCRQLSRAISLKPLERLGKCSKRMAGTTGLEPATSDVTGRRSNQLNYVPDFVTSVS
jgi:putative transposase